MNLEIPQETSSEFFRFIGFTLPDKDSRFDHIRQFPYLDTLLEKNIFNIEHGNFSWESKTGQEGVRKLWEDGYRTEPIAAMHMYRVACLTEVFANIIKYEQPYILSNDEQAAELVDASLLHDIGKTHKNLSIPLSTVFSTKEDFEKLRAARFMHPALGAEMIRHFGLNGVIQEIALKHHEKPDGSGYPRGLTLEQIPIQVQILKLCDSIDSSSAEKPWSEPKFSSPLSSIFFLKKKFNQVSNPLLFPSFDIFTQWACRPEATSLLVELMNKTHFKHLNGNIRIA